MNGWITSLKRKKHQRALNKAIRFHNKAIENDSLWKGRFFIKQVKSDFWAYEDKSGAELTAELMFCDKKTGFFYIESNTGNSWLFPYQRAARIFWTMNTFIVEKCDAWSENPSPEYDEIDYRKAKFIPTKRLY